MSDPAGPDVRADIQTYLHEHIPLSAAMAVEVMDCSTARVLLRAPLAPNINHRSTAFGGSVSAVAILAAWTWLHFTLRHRGLEVRLVIQSNQIDYLEPVADTFDAECQGVDPAQLDRFCRMLARRGRARLQLKSVVRCGDTVGATFSGEFVALRQ